MRRAPTLAGKVAFLKRPSSFGGHVRRVRAIETHFAWVFLAGDSAWKLKKPVRHKQMDYRALGARERGCRAELLLNRRAAPTVYRAVVPLTFSGGTLSIGGRGEVVDWLIHMRRLPDAAMLDHALSRGAVRPRDIDRIAGALLRFYARAPARPMSAARYLGHVLREIRSNAREIGRYADRFTKQMAREVCAAQLAALKRLRPMLARRGACVIDGHGDLRAEHIFIGPRIAIIDALEFDRRLRELDPAEEVAFLALEIERLGSPQLASRLLERFSHGMTSPPPAEVFSFYKSQRAATRAKLAAWHIGDPQFPDAAPWVARTESLLGDALRHAQAVSGPARAEESAVSVTDRRPAMEQGSERRACDHATHGFGEERGHMQFH